MITPKQRVILLGWTNDLARNEARVKEARGWHFRMFADVTMERDEIRAMSEQELEESMHSHGFVWDGSRWHQTGEAFIDYLSPYPIQINHFYSEDWHNTASYIRNRAEG